DPPLEARVDDNGTVAVRERSEKRFGKGPSRVGVLPREKISVPEAPVAVDTMKRPLDGHRLIRAGPRIERNGRIDCLEIEVAPGRPRICQRVGELRRDERTPTSMDIACARLEAGQRDVVRDIGDTFDPGGAQLREAARPEARQVEDPVGRLLARAVLPELTRARHEAMRRWFDPRRNGLGE